MLFRSKELGLRLALGAQPAFVIWLVMREVLLLLAIGLAIGVPAAVASGRFVSSHPTIKMLALSFLFLIGVLLIADGFDHHVPKGYVYFAMAFSVAVEMLNIRMRKRSASPVQLHQPYAPSSTGSDTQPG